MSKKRYIDTSFWSDTWVQDHLSERETYLFIYLMTNDKTNIAGVYEMSLALISLETKIPKNELVAVFNRLSKSVKYVNGYVILRKAIKHQNYKNSKLHAGIIEILQNIPHELFDYIDLPKDLNFTPVTKPNQTRLIDDSTMTLDETSHSNRDLNLNLNSNRNGNRVKNAESSNELTKTQKRSYAKAVRRDEELKVKEQKASERKPDGDTKSAAEVVRLKLRNRGLAV